MANTLRPTACASGQSSCLDLVGEFTRWGEDQCLGSVRLCAIDAGEKRKSERDGLAGSGRCLAGHVLAGKRIGDCRFLDGERFEDAALFERADE